MLNFKKKKCLVTGGAGFIGSHLVDQLLSAGARVRVLDNLVNGKQDNISHHFGNRDFEFFKGSVTDPFDVDKAMADVDFVFHLACLGVRHSILHPFENHRVNTEGTLLLLEAARKEGVSRFVHCSSSEVYGSARFVPMPESHPTEPCTVYGASKLAGEAYSRAYFVTYKLPVVTIRPFNTFGPRSHHEGDSGEMIPKSIVRSLAGDNILIFGDGKQTRDFTYVEDTARGLIAAALQDNLIGMTLNIGSNFEISIRELANKIIELVNNKKAQIEYTPGRPGDVSRLYADCSQFMDLINWQPEIDFNTGLQRTIEFFQNHPAGIKSLISGETGRNWGGE